MKSKLFIIIGVIIIFVLGVCFIYHWENFEDIYYSKVNNTNVKELTSGDMKYEYTLNCYDKDGKEKEFSFKTYKILRSEAYLKLTIKSLGVHSWEEINESELPDNVLEKLK